MLARAFSQRARRTDAIRSRKDRTGAISRFSAATDRLRMDDSRRFWVAPSSERSDDTDAIAESIVAIADGFDAATTRRSYQAEPWLPDAVLREMRDQRLRFVLNVAAFVIGGASHSLVNFRRPLLQELSNRGHEVIACAPPDRHSSEVRHGIHAQWCSCQLRQVPHPPCRRGLRCSPS